MAFLVESFSVWLILVMLTTLLLTYRKTIHISFCVAIGSKQQIVK